MAHIQLSAELPGILGPLTFSPETAPPLLETGGNTVARLQYAHFRRA